MESKLAHIIELAKDIERAECSADWFDNCSADNRLAAKAEAELEAAVEEFLKEYGHATAR